MTIINPDRVKSDQVKKSKIFDILKHFFHSIDTPKACIVMFSQALLSHHLRKVVNLNVPVSKSFSKLKLVTDNLPLYNILVSHLNCEKVFSHFLSFATKPALVPLTMAP